MATIQDVFSHIYTTEAHLGDVPVKNGQIILCTDSEKLYIDHGTTRVSTSDVVQVDNQEALPLAPLDKLYITKDTGDIFFYINGAWEKINQSDISVGAGLSGNGSSSSPLQLDIKNYSSTDNINLTSSNQVNVTGTNSISLLSNDNQSSIEISATGIVLNSYVGVTINSQGNALSFATGTNPSGERDIYLDNHSMNTAGGFAVVDLTTGKLPIGIIPDVTGDINIDNYTSNSTIRLTSTAGAVNLISNIGEVGLYSGSNVYVKVLTDTVELKATTVSLNGHAQNTSGGFVVVDSSTGKIPASIVPETAGSVDLSAYNGLVGITTTGASAISNGASGEYKFTLGTNSNGVILTEDGSTKSITVRSMKKVSLEGGEISIAGYPFKIHSNGKLELSSSQGNIILNAQDSVDANIEMHGTGILWNGAALNTANGLVTLNGSGKIPVSLYDVTVDLTDYSVSENISIKTTGSSSTLTLDGKTINIGNPNANQVFIQGLGVSLKCGEDSVYISGGTATTTVVATEKFYVNCPGEFESVNFLSNVQINNHDLNTAQGLVQLDANGKVPESLLPEIGNASWTKVTINQSSFATSDDTYGGSYYELNGICSVEVYDANGYKVEFDVKCDFTNSKTRIYIPSGLAADTISNWTLLYLAKTIA